MSTTRLTPHGLPGRPYGILGVQGGHNPGHITQLMPMAIPGRRYGVFFHAPGVPEPEPEPEIEVAPFPGGGGISPALIPFDPERDAERRRRRELSERHLRRTVEIATEGRVVSPDLFLDESELADEEEAIAILTIGLLS